MYVSNVIVDRAARIASSMAGKISTPFCNGCTRVAIDDRRAEQDAEFALELRVADAVAMLQGLLDLAFRRHEIQDDERWPRQRINAPSTPATISFFLLQAISHFPCCACRSVKRPSPKRSQRSALLADRPAHRKSVARLRIARLVSHQQTGMRSLRAPCGRVPGRHGTLRRPEWTPKPTFMSTRMPVPSRPRPQKSRKRHGLVHHVRARMRGCRHRRVARVRMQVVAGAFDAADDWIAERVKPGDVVVTADIPLASRCLQARRARCSALLASHSPMTISVTRWPRAN